MKIMSEQDWGLSEGYIGISDEWPPVVSNGFTVVGAWDNPARQT